MNAFLYLGLEMNTLTDLNKAAVDFITQGNVCGLAQCLEYSLQAEKVLQAIFDCKRYACLPPVLPFLHSLFAQNDRHPLGMAILLDLLALEKPLPHIKTMDMGFFFQQAVQRKLRIDFAQNNFLDKKLYHMEILRQDCVELFTALQEDIARTFTRKRNRLLSIIINSGALKICKAIPFTVNDFNACFYPLLAKYTNCYINSLPEAKECELLLRHLLGMDFWQEQIHKVSYELEENESVANLTSLLRLGYQMKEDQKQAIRTHNPALYITLFGEDV